jgi:ectoine hydroxylase-related dioxygenase (phytanoyl-CoA dioxygenase family)
MLTPKELSHFQEQGYVIVKQFLTLQEANRLYEVSKNDQSISQHSYSVKDAEGNESKLALWYTPGDNIYGMLSRGKRLVKSVEQLIGSPVAHFHSKVMQKVPKVGGAWEWHQDYGYWYRSGFMYADKMLSVMFALTRANKENGCLRVLPCSHKLGRLEHGKAGEQVGADMHMVNKYKEKVDEVYCELEVGDALFFHSNLLHASGPNRSELPRWSIISCYNHLENTPDAEPHSSFVPVNMVADGKILSADITSGKKADFSSKKTESPIPKLG